MNSLVRDVIAFIPGRIGSKGIAKKNLQTIGNSSLIKRSWQHANILFPSMRRMLSVDSEDLAKEAGISEKIWRQIKLGEIAEVSSGDFLHKRESEKAKDKSLIGETLIDLENQLELLGIYFTHILMLQPTTPFRNRSESLKLFEFAENLPESLFSVTSLGPLDSSRIYKTNGKILVALEENLIISTKPRQELSELYIRDGGYYLISRENCRIGKPIGINPSYITREFPYNINIDAPKDLELARVVYESAIYRKDFELE